MNSSGSSREIIDEAVAQALCSVGVSYQQLIHRIEHVMGTKDMRWTKFIFDFAQQMASRLYDEMIAGRTGWNDPDQIDHYKRRLIQNVKDGHWVDVANYAFFLWVLSAAGGMSTQKIKLGLRESETSGFQFELYDIDTERALTGVHSQNISEDIDDAAQATVGIYLYNEQGKKYVLRNCPTYTPSTDQSND